MMKRWPAALVAETVAGTGGVRLEDAATSGLVRGRLGCDCRSDLPSAAVNDKRTR